MKIITFNIWNHDSNFDTRMELVNKIIAREGADVVALQEVRSGDVARSIQESGGFQFKYWKKYHDCEEGLAILSKHKILSTWTNWDESIDVHNSGSMYIEVEYEGLKIGIANVHLDYRFAHNRELEILKLTDYISTQNTDYNLMLGDFNTYPSSSIHGYLSGRQSLNGRSARWIDLGESFALRNRVELKHTIDFYNNPRWRTDQILDIPGRFDWILLQNPYPNSYPELYDYRLIGKEETKGITASDHYGVVCKLNFNV